MGLSKRKMFETIDKIWWQSCGKNDDAEIVMIKEDKEIMIPMKTVIGMDENRLTCLMDDAYLMVPYKNIRNIRKGTEVLFSEEIVKKSLEADW